MKLKSLLAAFFLLALYSCKKSASDAPSNTISATIDGVVETFNTGAVAQIGTGVRLNSNLLISGSNGSAVGSDGLSITINANNTIAKGSYVSGDDSVGGVSILYSKGPFSLIDPNIYTTDPDGPNPTTITITSMSATNLKGTFNGKLVFRDGVTLKTVTDGKFNLTIK